MCLRCYHVSSYLGHTMNFCLKVKREAKTGKMAPHVDVKFTFVIRHIIHSKTRWSSHCKINVHYYCMPSIASCNLYCGDVIQNAKNVSGNGERD